MSYFDLEEATERVQEDFLEDIAEALMESVFRKAWLELNSDDRKEFTRLLEESGAEPENEEKSNAIFTFLDEHVINIRGHIENEFTNLQTSYKKTRDELLDSVE